VRGLIAAVRRRPVRVYLYGLCAPGFALAVAYGALSADKAALWIALAGGVLVVGAGEYAQTKTTPLADPRTAAGKPAYIAEDTPAEPERWS
jgi:hypothetical protein